MGHNLRLKYTVSALSIVILRLQKQLFLEARLNLFSYFLAI